MMKSWKSLTALAVFLAASMEAHGQETIVDYVPMNPVHDIMNLALDLDAMGRAVEGKSNFDAAFKIYNEGGHSESVAKLEVRDGGLKYFLDEGTIVSGESVSGAKVTGTVMKDYLIGDREVEVMYNQDVGCFVGGLERPDDAGCFVQEGTLTVSGQSEPLPYFYNVFAGNINLRTIAQLSKNAEAEFSVNGEVDKGMFPEFSKFVEYFGSPTYADDIMLAVFRGREHEFPKHTFDFGGWSDEDRAWLIERGPAYMNVAMHVLGQFEKARIACVEGCTGDDCNRESILHLDAAVALYTGSLYQSKNEGNMMYGLADQMCKIFKTCGWDVDSITGTSHVNLINFVKFKDAQTKFQQGACTDADTDLRVVAKMMFVPLWQGLLYSGYHKLRREGTVFAIATLPLLEHCSEGWGNHIFRYFLPDSTDTIHFPYMKKIMERFYSCIDLDCQSMGGIWREGKQEWVK